MMIKRYMKYLESKNLPAIAKELKVTLEEVVEAVKLLPKLDPKPGRNFSGDDAPYISPDVFVYKMGEEYTVVLNDDGLSKLRISSTYRNALKNGAVSPGQTKEFIQDKLRSAQWLIRSIHQRQRTIYKVTESIVEVPAGLPRQGRSRTSSRSSCATWPRTSGCTSPRCRRVTTSKYVHTPQGIFELKYFFNSSIARVSRRGHRERGGEAPHQAAGGAGGSAQSATRTRRSWSCFGAGHGDRPAHGGQVPRGAGHPPEQQAQALLLREDPGDGRQSPQELLEEALPPPAEERAHLAVELSASVHREEAGGLSREGVGGGDRAQGAARAVRRNPS